MTHYLKIKLDDERELHITHYHSGGFSEDLQQAVLVHTQEGKNEVLTPITPSPLHDCSQQPVPQEADYPVEVPENGVERLTFVRYVLNHVTDNVDEVLARHAQEKQDEVHRIREELIALVTDPVSDKIKLRSVVEELIVARDMLEYISCLKDQQVERRAEELRTWEENIKRGTSV